MINVRYDPREIFKALKTFKKKGIPHQNPLKGLRRNDKCGCGSGLKFKKCCWNNVQDERRFVMAGQESEQQSIRDEFEKVLAESVSLDKERGNE